MLVGNGDYNRPSQPAVFALYHLVREAPRVFVPEEQQARKIKHKAIPEWAEGLYYNKGFFSEALVYHDDEAIYFECRGKDDGLVRYTFEMIEGLRIVEDEEHEDSTQ